MELLIIFGPPAVGKMTVGAALSRITGWPLFHNHVTIEAVLSVFGFDHPAFWPLVLEFRRRIFEEAIANGLPGLIYTFAWTLSDPRDKDYIDGLKALVESRGGTVRFAELEATYDERVRRNEHPDRMLAKPSKRDVDASRQFLSGTASLKMNTDGEFWYPERHVRIHNTQLSPDAAAIQIADTFRLPHR